MTKKLFLGIGVIALIGIGIASCLPSSSEYIPVLDFDGNNEIALEDSIIVQPFIIIDGRLIRSRLEFRGVKKQLVFNSIELEIISAKYPEKRMELSHVFTYKDTVNWERANDYIIRAHNFAELPNKYKLISPNREENAFQFMFKKPDILESETYLLKIKLMYLIDDKEKVIEKELQLKKTMQWKEVPMMT